MAGSKSFEKVQERIRAALARNVCELRLSLGMTQAELAKRADIRRALISEIEREEANPTLETLVRVAAALRVDAAELLAGKR
ncbi:helix-turn-helix domain-containing protein [Bradyrhizobium canariense]|uniref:helix-turn-helix domain-containing protein n=1 Tax=Bradyrhizobium canariense TaxID=255045 RepID=UPI00269A0098